MNRKFRIELLKEQLTFSAAHFITFGDNICERIHGHNYGVRCSVEGPLNEHGYVVDFIALRDRIATIAGELDHHVLLPTKHPTIQVATSDEEVTVKFEDRRWVFPLDDCVLLPIENTTAELLASYIADQIISDRGSWSGASLSRLVVAVDENQGQWGECVVDLDAANTA